MLSIAIRAGIIVLVSAAMVSCASPYVGAWEHDDLRSFFRVTLAEDGTCHIVAGGYVGQFREGIGGRCRYSRVGDLVSITAIGEIDGSGLLESLPSPMQFKFEPDTGRLAALGSNRITLVRVPK